MAETQDSHPVDVAIIGGGLIPAVMGKISDLSNIQKAFIVPLLCYLYVIYFAVRGYKPNPSSSLADSTATAEAK